MATWDTADLVRRCLFKARRPDTDEEMLDSSGVSYWYDLLTEAQSYWYALFASYVPDALYGPPVLMTTEDCGYTYNFGTVAAPIYPMGHTEIRETRGGRVMIPGTDWQERDFVMEGSRIRMPNGRSRTFTDGPYARFVTEPPAITAAVQPSLTPPSARILLVNRALILWAGAGGLRDPSPFEREEAANWAAILNRLRTQYHLAGAVAVDDDTLPWWTSIDTGEGYTRYSGS